MSSQLLDFIKHKPVEAITTELLSEESFREHAEHFSHLPWLKKIKEDAWQKFSELPMPKRTDEEWRFSSVRDFSVEGYHLSQAPSEHEQGDILEASNFTDNYAGRLVFEDNHIISHDYVSEELADKGVIWEPLQEAFEKHPELVQKYFAQAITRLGGQKFQYLNIAYAHTGSFLYVPKGVVINEPFLAYHWANAKGSALFPQTIIVAEESSEVSLVDIYNSHGEDSAGFSIATAATYAADNAKVSRITLQNWNEKTTSFQLDSTFVGKDTQTKAVAVNLGSSRARFENQLVINGAGADARLHSLTVSDENQEFDQRTHQHHGAPNAVSDLLYKNALTGSSKTIFSGMILVDKVAQKTDAYQTNRNLILSDSAEANSLPGLEIEANDVKCSHGATSGRLDETDLFYMLSRGISKEQARELLVFGFFEEVLSKIDNEEIVSEVNGLIQGKFIK